jgi:hypothetical protein
MQAAQHAPAAARTVVLHEPDRAADQRIEDILPVGFEEAAPLVLADDRLEQQHAGNGRIQDVHRDFSSSIRRTRYWP